MPGIVYDFSQRTFWKRQNTFLNQLVCVFPLSNVNHYNWSKTIDISTLWLEIQTIPDVYEGASSVFFIQYQHIKQTKLTFKPFFSFNLYFQNSKMYVFGFFCFGLKTEKTRKPKQFFNFHLFLKQNNGRINYTNIEIVKFHIFY